jgi:tRNA(His) 5'-end guanylyltransferase
MKLNYRMKLYEKQYEYSIDDGWCVIRLDMRAGSTFTKSLKPRGQNKHYFNAMTETTRRLISEFKACTGYTQSDEINLVFSNINIFNKRLQKIISIIASYASSIFNIEFIKNTNKELNNNLYKVGIFDARIISLPNQDEVYNCIMNRGRDAIRNSISNRGLQKFSSNKLHNKNISEIKDMLNEVNYSWDELAPSFKYGSLIKQYLKEYTNNYSKYYRIEFCELHIPLNHYTIELSNLICSKYISKEERSKIV